MRQPIPILCLFFLEIPKKLGLPSSVYPVEVLHHLLGAKAEQHVLASNSSSSSSTKQASKKSLRGHRGSKPASKYLKTTGEPRRITANKFRCVLSRLARSTADLVSKNGLFWAVFRTIIPKTQDDRQCVKCAFAMRAVVLPWRLGNEMMANGCSIRRVPCRGATRWSILR